MESENVKKKPLILVTGASGFIGHQVVEALVNHAWDIRAMVRSALKVDRFHPSVNVVRGDLHNLESLDHALSDVTTAIYLVHSIHAGEKHFSHLDRKAAQNFAEAAKKQGVEHIIYLGGIRPEGPKVSAHLKSRSEVGDILRSSGIALTEFRAGMIVGEGSLSFEIVRYLVERVPLLICPKWFDKKSLPMDAHDVVSYITKAVERGPHGQEIFDIGGPEPLSPRDILAIYASIRGLRRIIIQIPFLNLTLSSLWLSLVTPFRNSITRTLVVGLKNSLLCDTSKATQTFQIQPRPLRESLKSIFSRLHPDLIHPLSDLPTFDSSVTRHWQSKGFIVESHSALAEAPVDCVFKVLLNLGGQNGWPFANFLWKIRGWIDRCMGGVGLRASLPRQNPLMVGDTLDFWRIERLSQNHDFLLRAEMKVPGSAWLRFQATPGLGGHTTLIQQTAYFAPKGLFGVLYWYSLYPLHRWIFRGTIRSISHQAAAHHRRLEFEKMLPRSNKKNPEEPHQSLSA